MKAKVVKQDNDDDAVQLAHTAKILRKDLFEKSSYFNGSFRKGSQEDSVPELLLALVSMILDGPNVKRSNQYHPGCFNCYSTIKI